MKQIITGNCIDVLEDMDDESVDCVVTSPPYYGLRDYGVDEQVGLEETPQAYINKLVDIFGECRRILKDDGTLWLNIGDSYCGTGDKGRYKDPKYADGRNGQSVARNRNVIGCKQKDLIGIPWMLAFALRDSGWYLRQDIIWHKPNPMPESVKDRCTKSHEYIFLMSKKPHYYFDYQAIQEEAQQSTYDRLSQNIDQQQMHERRADGEPDAIYIVRNKRDVWSVTTKGFKEAHFAVFPEDLIEPCILAGCPKGGTVLDPFCGSGTTGVVSVRNERNFIGIELNPEYAEMSERRITKEESQGIQMSFIG